MKKMKFISGLMAMTMTAMSLSAVAFAADTVQVTVGQETIAVGGTFSVDVSLGSVPAGGINTIDFAINYDANVIDVTDVKLGAAGDTGAASKEGELGDTVFSWYDNGSQIVVVWSTGLTETANWITKDGVLLTISGKAADTAKEGDKTDLTVAAANRESYPKSGADNSEVLFVNVDGDAYDYKATNGFVAIGTTGVPEVQWGNVDCSTESTPEAFVTIGDAVLLARLVAEDETVEVSVEGKANADVKNDGTLDAQDVNLILQYLAKLIPHSDLGKA